MCGIFLFLNCFFKSLLIPEGFHIQVPACHSRRSFKLSCLLCLEGTKKEEKKKKKECQHESPSNTEGAVTSFLNLKHCCLKKSAFSGAYYSRLPLTQDWLPFCWASLYAPPTPTLHPTWPSVPLTLPLPPIISMEMSALMTEDIRHTRVLYVDVLYIVSLSYGRTFYLCSLDHSQLECDCWNHKNILWDCHWGETLLYGSCVASFAAVFVL